MGTLKKKKAPLGPPRAPPELTGSPEWVPRTPPGNGARTPGPPRTPPGPQIYAKNAPRTPPGSALAFFEKRRISSGKPYILRMAASKTDFVNVPRSFWALRGGLGGALMAPRLSLEPPLEIVSARVRLTVFSVPGGPPPKTQSRPKHTYLQWFLMIFRETRARKWAPPGPPLI